MLHARHRENTKNGSPAVTKENTSEFPVRRRQFVRRNWHSSPGCRTLPGVSTLVMANLATRILYVHIALHKRVSLGEKCWCLLCGAVVVVYCSVSLSMALHVTPSTPVSFHDLHHCSHIICFSSPSDPRPSSKPLSSVPSPALRPSTPNVFDTCLYGSTSKLRMSVDLNDNDNTH